MTADGTHTYQWDAESRLPTLDGSAASYAYNYDSQRVKRVVGATTTLYMTRGFSGPVLNELVNGAWSKDYIYLGDDLLATESSSQGTRYHFSDALGTPRAVTDPTGAVVARHDYDPFGVEMTAWSDGETHKFTGWERDAESSLDHALFRMYASQYHRWMTPDEFTDGPVSAYGLPDPTPPGPLAHADILNPQSLNRYAYVLSNPANLGASLVLKPGGIVSSAYLRNRETKVK